MALNVATDKIQNLELFLDATDFAKFLAMEDFKHYKLNHRPSRHGQTTDPGNWPSIIEAMFVSQKTFSLWRWRGFLLCQYHDNIIVISRKDCVNDNEWNQYRNQIDV